MSTSTFQPGDIHFDLQQRSLDLSNVAFHFCLDTRAEEKEDREEEAWNGNFHGKLLVLKSVQAPGRFMVAGSLKSYWRCSAVCVIDVAMQLWTLISLVLVDP